MATVNTTNVKIKVKVAPSPRRIGRYTRAHTSDAHVYICTYITAKYNVCTCAFSWRIANTYTYRILAEETKIRWFDGRYRLPPTTAAANVLGRQINAHLRNASHARAHLRVIHMCVYMRVYDFGEYRQQPALPMCYCINPLPRTAVLPSLSPPPPSRCLFHAQ